MSQNLSQNYEGKCPNRHCGNKCEFWHCVYNFIMFCEKSGESLIHLFAMSIGTFVISMLNWTKIRKLWSYFNSASTTRVISQKKYRFSSGFSFLKFTSWMKRMINSRTPNLQIVLYTCTIANPTLRDQNWWSSLAKYWWQLLYNFFINILSFLKYHKRTLSFNIVRFFYIL